MADSSTGGYIVPAPVNPPVHGDPLADFLQAVVAGITGLPGPLVRPRFQPEPPEPPPVTTDWAAIGILRKLSEGFAVVTHDGALTGSDTTQRYEKLELMVSFYGPNADEFEGRFRDGLCVSQNLEVLGLARMAHVDLGVANRLPALFRERWREHVDVLWTVARVVQRVYPILNLSSASGVLQVADPLRTETLNVNQ